MSNRKQTSELLPSSGQKGYQTCSISSPNETSAWARSDAFTHSHYQRQYHKAKPRPSSLRICLSSVFLTLVFMFGVRTLFTSQNGQIAGTEVLSSAPSPYDIVKELPSSQSIRELFVHYSKKSQLAGTEEVFGLTEWTRDQFTQFGLSDAAIETYYPVLNYPLERKLSIVNGSQDLLYNATLRETDDDVLPTFHAYSADGNVTGPIVYVHYGRLEDFVWLSSQPNITLQGSIALMRHGQIPGSIKIQHAEQFGCIGALVYTDPADTDLPTLVHRESVAYAHHHPGDPFSPGFASTKANESDIGQNTTIPSIPSLPISWSDALPLLRTTQGLGYTHALWIGGSQLVGYYTGPSQALVQLVNINKMEKKPIMNVVARIPGLEESDQTIIVGAHRDAWGRSAADPSSGSAILLELARVFGVLLEKGWRPRRSIQFISWDATEYGNVGSTEWVEDHIDWLKDHGVAYLDVSHAAVTGPHFSAQASPMLQGLLEEITSTVVDPRTSQSVYDAWANHESSKNSSLPLAQLISTWQDAVAFYQMAGVSSLSISFSGEKYDVGHSMFDSIAWMERFGDPTFEYHQTLVKIWALLTMRLSSDMILPLDPLDYPLTIIKYLEHLLYQQAHTNDQDLPSLYEALTELQKTAIKFNRKVQKIKNKLEQFDESGHHHKKRKKLNKKIQKLNSRLVKFERNFVNNQGLLANRPWYKHAIFGPLAETGETQVFPSLVEATEEMVEREQVLVDILRNAKAILAKGHSEKSHDLLDTIELF
ncbi:hypothetical protein EDC96DRAFT_511233 [Choanephora cucurbitarum]|nr:hypothetical protein EDC96DRAFT_511233 [Choanephora cucurbitarum]